MYNQHNEVVSYPCATDCGISTNEYTAHHNIRDGKKTAEELTEKELFPVTISTQKNFWSSVK
jgi:hypothetical protein